MKDGIKKNDILELAKKAYKNIKEMQSELPLGMICDDISYSFLVKSNEGGDELIRVKMNISLEEK